ncbi:7820_t:CDS:2 [Dentiscutata erythropus]|uniref:7820_t:CDS:1 n=1 Tax=Dentiscutata erythropus TaxID=1348616 RepID=A0A9N9CD58_9GLOM|nr:7820_t:CDS:2 [Dentiscutata erythropus]
MIMKRNVSGVMPNMGFSCITGQVLEFVPFEDIFGIEHLGKGGYGSVYKAKWTRGPIEYYDNDVHEWHRSGEKDIVLKSIKSLSNNNIPDKEIKAQMTSFVDIGYTISENPDDRPTALELCDVLYGCRQKGHEIWTQIELIEKNMTFNVPPEMASLHYITSENAIYTSRLLDISQELVNNISTSLLSETELKELMIHDTANSDPFNNIKFFAFTPVIKNGSKSVFLGDSMSEFVSIRSTISPGTSADANDEVKRLLSLLEDKTNDINHILDPLQVYAVGPDFQKDYSMPCIACWSTESLDDKVIERLSKLFEDKYKVVNKVGLLDTSVNSGDSGDSIQDDLFNNNSITSEFNNKGSSKEEEYITITSTATAVDKNNPKKNCQDFSITVKILAKVIPVINKSYLNILEFYVNVYDCKMGPMLSKNWKSLHDLGFGYFLDSVEIKVSPISLENDNISHMIVPKSDYKQPQQLNRPTEITSDHETNKGVEGQINGSLPNGVLGFQIKGNYGVKNANSAKTMTYEWKVEREGSNKTGVCWTYRPVKNIYEREYVPGDHSGQWYTLNTMRGFKITITQILRCEFRGRGWGKSNKKVKLIKLCPKMAHTLEITFNSIDNFNENFAKLKRDYFEHENLIATLNASNMHNIENTLKCSDTFIIDRKFLQLNE